MGGDSTDIPVPGDYDGDGAMDLALFRRSSGAWSVLWSSANFTSGATYYCGQFSDTPVPGDYDGDGKTDPAVYRRATGEWFILQSSQYSHYPPVRIEWGNLDNLPVPGDYDGDHRTDIAVFRPYFGAWLILKSSSDYTTSISHQWGTSGGVPVLGR